MQKARISKLNKYVSSILLMLSLCASSIAACVCAAHETVRQMSESEHCHSSQKNQKSAETSHHSHEAAKAENHHDKIGETPDGSPSAAANDDCCCIQSAPKSAAKSENYKVENPAAIHSAEKSFEITRKWQALTIKIVRRAAPFYLSDSFYNLSPGRAPPFFQA